METKIGEFHGVLAVERTRFHRNMNDHVLGLVVNGDVALLHTSAECLDDFAGVIHENSCVAPVREDFVGTPVPKSLPEPNERPIPTR